MATSGSVDFGMDARAIITEAFQTAKIIAAGETPGADEMADGENSLESPKRKKGEREKFLDF